ncbi:MAG: hypothetical protein ACTHJH_13390 [Marmoricola sp.]
MEAALAAREPVKHVIVEDARQAQELLRANRNLGPDLVVVELTAANRWSVITLLQVVRKQADNPPVTILVTDLARPQIPVLVTDAVGVRSFLPGDGVELAATLCRCLGLEQSGSF